MWISPKFSVAHWKALDLTQEKHWAVAVRILDDRIAGRFFEPVKRMESYRYAGFAVLALDCLLIETLQQFREGVNTTPSRQGGAFFERFLTQTTFGQWFNADMAGKFYDQFRCGILHQAEIKKTSTVERSGTLACLTKDGSGLVINRRAFHGELRKVFAAYIAELRNRRNHALRENFKRKMAYICRQ